MIIHQLHAGVVMHTWWVPQVIHQLLLIVAKSQTIVGPGISSFFHYLRWLRMSECLFTMNSYLLAACWSGAIIHSYVCQSQVASGLECVAEWLKPAMEADMSQWQRDQQVRFEEE